MKKLLLFFCIIILSTYLHCQYIGIACSDDYHYAQTFYMDNNGNITLGEIFTTGGFPYRIDISDSGLVLIANNGYSELTKATITVLKINLDGSVYKVRDVDLGGQSWDVCITPNNKYALVIHRIELPDDEWDYGISVLEITNDDVLLPIVDYISLKNEGVGIINLDVNQNGIVLGLERTPLIKCILSIDGDITYTNETLELQNIVPYDIEFNCIGNRCFTICDNGLAIIDVDEENNVSLWGYVNTSPKLYNPRDIVITPDSKLILESFESLGNAVAKFRNNEDGTVQYIDKVEMERPGAMGMTPDGQYIVVAYNYTITKTDMTVLRINPDETITRLADKDVEGPRGINCIGMYKLPETSVETNWEFYK